MALADYDPNEAFDTENELGESREAIDIVKEFSIIIIDARSTMNVKHATAQTSQVLEAIGAVCKFLQMKAATADSTKVAILFSGIDSMDGSAVPYNSPLPSLQNRVVQMTGLQTPGVESIKRLQAYVQEPELLTRHFALGSGDSSLDEAITVAQGLFLRAKARPQDVRRINIFTNDERPRDAAAVRSKVRDVGQDYIAVRLYPLRPPSGQFDPSLFWQEALHTERAEGAGAGGAGASSAAEGQAAEADEEGEDEIEVFDTLEGIVSGLRKREPRKRVARRTLLTLAPGVHISVGLFHNISQAKKPTVKRATLHAGQLVPVRSVTRLVEGQTGEVVDAENVTKGVFVGGQLAFVSTKEAREMGKPRSTLRETDNVSPAVLVYPSDKDVMHSSTAFRALWQRMIQRDVVAIAKFVPKDNDSPVLWALLPERERVNEMGVQVWPPGLYGIKLPNADDFRHIPVHAPATSMRASQPQLQLASKMVSAYTVPDAQTWDLASAEFMNPSLQMFYKGLEAQAFAQPGPQPDPTLDEFKALRTEEVQPELEAYLAGFENISGEGAAPSQARQAGVKRKAEAPATSSDHDEVALAAAGTLKSLKVDELKEICRKRSLKVSGNKGDLLTRIEEDIAQQR